MRVYRVVSSIEHPKTGKEIYSAVQFATAADEDFVRFVREFNGEPFSNKWRPVAIKPKSRARPLPDFLNLSPKILVCNQKAFAVVGECIAKAGEALPLEEPKGASPCVLVNIISKCNAFDRAKSKWDAGGGRKRLLEPAFNEKKFKDETVFKIEGDTFTQIYCVERTGKAGAGEFKALVEENNLTGLEFELVWDSEGIAKDAQTSQKAPSPSQGKKVKGKASSVLRAVEPGEMKDIHASAELAAKELKISSSARPAQVVTAIRARVDDIQKQKSPVSQDDLKDFAVNLGCLWGEKVCAQCKWEWRFMESKNPQFVVVAPDESYVVAPMPFLLKQLTAKRGENTTLLLFKMIEAGLPTVASGSCTSIG